MAHLVGARGGVEHAQDDQRAEAERDRGEERLGSHAVREVVRADPRRRGARGRVAAQRVGVGERGVLVEANVVDPSATPSSCAAEGSAAARAAAALRST